MAASKLGLLTTNFRIVSFALALKEEFQLLKIAFASISQQDQPVPKHQLQLVGVTAMFLAAKYEEMSPPEISSFSFVTDGTYTTAQIRNMEVRILKVLDFTLGRPLPLQFLRRASKVTKVCVAIQYLV